MSSSVVFLVPEKFFFFFFNPNGPDSIAKTKAHIMAVLEIDVNLPNLDNIVYN